MKYKMKYIFIKDEQSNLENKNLVVIDSLSKKIRLYWEVQNELYF